MKSLDDITWSLDIPVEPASLFPPKLNDGKELPEAGVLEVAPAADVAGFAPNRLPPNRPPPVAGVDAGVEPLSAGLVVLPKRLPVVGAVEARIMKLDERDRNTVQETYQVWLM